MVEELAERGEERSSLIMLMNVFSVFCGSVSPKKRRRGSSHPKTFLNLPSNISYYNSQIWIWNNPIRIVLGPPYYSVTYFLPRRLAPCCRREIIIRIIDMLTNNKIQWKNDEDGNASPPACVHQVTVPLADFAMSVTIGNDQNLNLK